MTEKHKICLTEEEIAKIAYEYVKAKNIAKEKRGYVLECELCEYLVLLIEKAIMKKAIPKSEYEKLYIKYNRERDNGIDLIQLQTKYDKLKEDGDYWKHMFKTNEKIYRRIHKNSISTEKVREDSEKLISLFKQFKTNNGRLADLDWVLEELDKYQKQLLGEKQ